MNTLQKIICAAIFATGLLFTSCKKDDPVSCNYGLELQDELNAVNAAATTFGNDPTPANCQAYKNSLQTYLNEAENLIDCATTAGQGAELQASIDQSQAAVDAIQC